MKRALLVATGLLAISSTASAGGYLGLGLGTPPGVNDEMATTAAPDGRSLRGLGGMQFGRFSVEGALNGFGVITHHGDQNVYQASVAAKYNLPLGNKFEAFGRAGLERTWLSLDDDRYNFAGNGFLIGAGFEYRFDLSVTHASIFVDYMIHHASLENTRGKLDETSRIWGLGFTVGI
jgi:outer membrane protein with beta-barrel domain